MTGLARRPQRRNRRGRHEDDHHGDWHIDPKRPPPGQIVGEVPAQQRPDDRRDTEDRAQDALIAAPFPERDHLADQRAGRDRDSAAADPLQGARSHQHGHRMGQPAGHRSDDEEHHRGLEHPFAAEQIPELADQRGDDRRRQQIAGDNPGLTAGVAQVGDDRRQRGGNDRLVQRREQHAQHDRDEDEVAALRADQRAAGRGLRDDTGSRIAAVGLVMPAFRRRPLLTGAQGSPTAI